MRSIRAAVLSFSLVLTATVFLPSSALAQRSIGGQMGRAGHFGGHIGIRARGFVGPVRMGHISRGGFRHHGFHGPFVHHRFDHFGFFGFPHDQFFFGFPQRDFFFGFPHRRFGFFGFPKHRFGFFGFPDNHFFFGFPHRHGFLGFRRHHFGFFGHPGFAATFGFGALPVFYGGAVLPSAVSPYVGAPPASRVADTPPAGDMRPLVDPRMAVPGAGGVGDSLVVERVAIVDEVTATGLRLTWKDAGQVAAEVALFLADSARSMLSVQTVRTPPYTALFEPPPGTAFAGMTVAWPDGSTSTRFVSYRALRR